MNGPVQRPVARALRAGGPEVIEVAAEQLQPPGTGEALIKVEVAGLNHAETLIRAGNYTVRLPFPYPVGGEGSAVVIAVGPETPISVGSRVCWAGVVGSCGTYVVAPASMLAPIPDGHRVKGVSEFRALISEGLTLAAKTLAIISEIAGRFSLDQIIDAYRKSEPILTARCSCSPVSDGLAAASWSRTRLARMPIPSACCWLNEEMHCSSA